MTDHHRFLLRQLFDHLRFTESKLSQIEQEIDRRMRPFQDEVIRLRTTPGVDQDRKSTRLNSSHGYISYAVFCLKKKKKQNRKLLGARLIQICLEIIVA